MHDRFKKRVRASETTPRVRRQIALEAARRMYSQVAQRDDATEGFLKDASESDYYTAKRKAAAVLGHRVRPGDLPSDSEVREQVLTLARAKPHITEPLDLAEIPDAPDAIETMARHVDRFAIYKLRLTPLENVKQNPRVHPEGDALFHSLQVFERAREARPYDEEFLLAALLHDVGKAIDPHDHVGAGIDALRDTVTERTLWLIEHHMDLLASRDRPVGARVRKALEGSEYFDDLKLLRELDDAGRDPGAPVGTIDEALEYLRALEREDYLDD
jgi:hypothetical protein